MIFPVSLKKYLGVLSLKANRLKNAGSRIFLPRRRAIVILVCAVIGTVFLFFSYRIYRSNPPCAIQKVVFIDNKRLTEDELTELIGSQINRSLLTVSCAKISKRMLRSPWIRSANVRKEFPGTLSITIQEAEPFALLDMHEHLFLIDERGKFLEELKDDAVPFLPIIVSDPYRSTECFAEALNLVRLMNNKGLTAGKSHIEVIARKPHELSVEMDEVTVRIGVGDYEGKLERLMHLEGDLHARNISVDYIDLRFGDKAIVKPITVRKVGE